MFLMFLHKIWGLGSLLLQEELKAETFMCASNFLVYFASFSISLVMLVRPKETMALLNSWPLILSCLKQAGKPEPTQFDVMSEAVKLISFFAMTQGVAVSAPVCSLLVSTMPTCLLPTTESLGLIPQGLLPRFAWQLLFLPLEYATHIPPMLLASLVLGILLVLIIGLSRIYCRKLR